jgi:signal recognition particle subunit SRP54
MPRDFTLDDFRQQLDQIQKMGSTDILNRLPGTSEMMSEEPDPDVALRRIRRMIDAMTDEERSNPDRIDSSSRSRIAESAGTQPHDVELFLFRFRRVRATMRELAGMSLWERLKMVTGFGKFPGKGGET